GREELGAFVCPARPTLSPAIELRTLAERLVDRDGLTARQTTFTLPELVCAVAGALAEGAPADAVLEAAAQLTQLPALQLVEPQETPGRPPRFTTSELHDV